jgi:uncharacterized membrane protein
MRQSLTKTASFAVIHFGVAFSVTYALTGSAPIATTIALLEPAVNTVAYFLHEQVWHRVERVRATSLAR